MLNDGENSLNPHLDIQNMLFEPEEKNLPESNIYLLSSTLLPPKDRKSIEESEEISISDEFEDDLNEMIHHDLSVGEDTSRIFNDSSIKIEPTKSSMEEHPPNISEKIQEIFSDEKLREGSNYTYYDEEKVRVTRNPKITSSSKKQYQHDNYIRNSYSSDNNHKEQKLKGHKFTVTYWMFYPFSQGKQVCTTKLWFFGRVFKPRIRNKCFGETVTLNSHVGDWEHVSIYFEVVDQIKFLQSY